MGAIQAPVSYISIIPYGKEIAVKAHDASTLHLKGSQSHWNKRQHSQSKDYLTHISISACRENKTQTAQGRAIRTLIWQSPFPNPSVASSSRTLPIFQHNGRGLRAAEADRRRVHYPACERLLSFRANMYPRAFLKSPCKVCSERKPVLRIVANCFPAKW